MSRVADSSFLITCFDETDPRRSQAVAWLQDTTPIVIPPEIASETFGVLHVRRGSAVARGVFEALGRIAHVRFADDTSAEAVAKLFQGAPRDLTWADCAVVWRARKHGWPVLSYDPAIEREAKKRA